MSLPFNSKYVIFPCPLKNINNKIYKTIIIAVVLYGRSSWSLVLGEEHRLRILRGIFGPWKEVTGAWRGLHNEELHNLYASQYIIRVMKSRRMRWVGHVALWEDDKCTQNFGLETRREVTTWKT
jgi:hypothetical protein